MAKVTNYKEDKVDKEIKKLYKLHSSRDIGKLMGCSHQTVLNRLKDMGIDPREKLKRYSRFSMKDKKTILKQFQKGWSLKKISEKFKAAPSTIKRILAEYIDKSEIKKHISTKISSKVLEEMYRLYKEEKLGTYKLGKKFGYHPGTILNNFKSKGFPLRDRPGWENGTKKITGNNSGNSEEATDATSEKTDA